MLKAEPYQKYFIEAAQFLSSIMSDSESVPEMVTRKEWEAEDSSNLKKIYSPQELPRIAYRILVSKLFDRGGKLCTAKNISWTAKGFLAASRYQPGLLPLAEKTRDFLIHNFVDNDGGVMYNLYSKNRTLERDKFIRGTSIVFESLSCFLTADELY